AVAADRHVVGDRTAAEGDGAVVRAASNINRPAADRDGTAPAIAAAGSSAPVPAGGLVEGHRDVGDGRGREPVHRQPAANAIAAPATAAPGAADGGVVREGRVTQDEARGWTVPRQAAANADASAAAGAARAADGLVEVEGTAAHGERRATQGE